MKLVGCLTVSMVIVVLAGCGGGGESVSTLPAGGTVTFKDEPLADADVIFHPAAEGEGKRSASGKTDAQGKFTLFTYVDAGKQQPGAVPGEYSVTVNKAVGAATAMSPDAMMKSMAQRKSAPKKSGDDTFTPDSAIPEKYASPKSSGLKAVISEGGGNDNIKVELVGN